MNNKLKTFLSLFFVLALGFVLIACTSKKFTVTFDTDGGSAIAAVEVTENEKVSRPTDPTKDDFNFGEWQLDGDKFDFNTPITADITLKATWNAVDPDPVDPDPVDPTEVSVVFTVTLPEETPDHVEVYIAGNFDEFNSNLPRWKEGGEEALKLTRDGLTATITLTLDVKTGLQYKYTLGTWPSNEVQEDGSNLPDDGNRVVDVTATTSTFNDVVAKWAAIPEPPVDPDPVDPDPDAPTEVNVVFTVTLPADTPDGDIFLAGDLKHADLQAWGDEHTIKATRTGLTATFSITYDAEDLPVEIAYKWTRGNWATVEKGAEGEELGDRKVTITAENETVALNDTVASWADSGTDPVDPDPENKSEEATLYYEGETGLMTEGNNAELVNLDPELFTVTSTLRRLQEQYLQHVAVNEDGDIRLYGSSRFVSKNTLSVLIGEGFVITGVEITFAEGSNDPSSALLMLGEQQIDLVGEDIVTTTKSYKDLSIDGFSIRNNQSTGDKNSQIRIKDIVITYEEGAATSEFTPIPVIDVTFDLNYSDSTPIIHKFESADELTVPADPEREGYDFVGWFTDVEGTTPVVVEETTVTEAFTVYAKWEEQSSETLLAQAKEDLKLETTTFTENGTITLPTEGLFDVVITWASDNDAINIETGAVTLPVEPGTTTVTLTATLTLGEETGTKEFVITLVVADPDLPEEVLLYETGFETSDGFEAGNTYNNPEEVEIGNENNKWTVSMGTPTTTQANSMGGSQTLQMRYYTGTSGAAHEIGELTTLFKLKATKVEFDARFHNGNGGLDVKVGYSSDGVTWTDVETFELTSSKQNFTATLPEHETEVFVRFTVVTKAVVPTGTVHLLIDNVKIFGNSAS